MSNVLKCPVLESAPSEPRLVLEKRKLQIEDLGLNTFLNCSAAAVWLESGLAAAEPTDGEVNRVPTRRSQTHIVLSFEVIHDAM